MVEVGNPYDKETLVWIIGEQTNPLFRTYVETTWLWLRPGETRNVRVMVEYAVDPKSDRLPDDIRRVDRRRIEKLSRTPNRLGLHAYAENPHDNPRHALELLGGAGILVTTGRATEFERFSNDGSVVLGSIVTSDDGKPVPTGKVIVTVVDDPEAFERHATLSGDVRDGSFLLRFPNDDFKVMRAEYLPATGFGTSAIDWTERR